MSNKNLAARITIEWYYEDREIVLIPRNWSKVKAGEALLIRGKGFHADGESFWDYWSFNRCSPGSLEVWYGDDASGAYDGNFDGANIEEFLYVPKRKKKIR